MIFKNRTDAGEKLSQLLNKDFYIKSNLKKIIIVSLLRGGIVVGNVIAKSLKTTHLPLIVAKIPSPHNPELAIGALCFNTFYLEKNIIDSLGLSKVEITEQIKIAQEKFNSYLKKFCLEEKYYNNLKNKISILVDDGIATGSTVKAAFLYIKDKNPKEVFLAVPVGPADFKTIGFDKTFFLYRDPSFSSVSQFYKNFPQVNDEEVKELFD